MIETFNDLGKYLLNDDENRKKQFLLSEVIVPNEPVNDDDKQFMYEIVFNLKTNDNTIEIKIGEELDKSKKEKFFGFGKKSPNEKKIYFTTNNISYIIFNTIPDNIDYIENKLDEENQYRFKEFRKYLENIRDKFYFYQKDSNEKGFYFLNYNILAPEHRDKFNTYFEEEIKKKKIKDSKDLKNKIGSVYKKLIYSDILKTTSKNYKNINIFSLKVNNEYIHQSKYKDNYFELLYDIKCGSFFTDEKNIKENKLCYLCKENKVVTGKIDIPTKFYIIDKPYFFENGNDKNAYKSLAICEHCYQDLIAGINYVEDNLNDRLFGINYYLVPDRIKNISNLDEKLLFIKDILKEKTTNIEEEFNTKKNLIEEIKEENMRFNFLFYFKEKAAFNVIDLIPDIRFHNIENIFINLMEMNNHYPELYYGVDLNTLRYLLFPSKYSHRKSDPKLFRKELVQIAGSIFKFKKIDYKNLLKKFNFIYKKQYYKNESKINELVLNPLKMNIFLTLFKKLNILKGDDSDMATKPITKIENQDLKEFFEVHSGIYENNMFRQGVFILGMLINEIWRAQKDKKGNILGKINFDGMPVNRFQRFVNDITDFLKIYDKDIYNGIGSTLYANMMDRIQGIEDSDLTGSEVVFYLLSGLSFARYMGFKYAGKKTEKKEDDDSE